MKKIQKIILWVLLFVSIFRYYDAAHEPISKGSLSLSIISALIGFVILLIYKTKQEILNNNYLRIAVIFAIGFIIVHFFAYIEYIFDSKDLVSIAAYSKFNINASTVCSSCVLLCFVLGYITFDGTYFTREKQTLKSSKKFTPKSTILMEVFMFVFLCVFFLTIDRRYFHGGYGYIANHGGLHIVPYMCQTFILSLQIGCSLSRIFKYRNAEEQISFITYVKSYSAIYYVSIIIYTLLIIASGDRGPLIYIYSSYFMSYFLINRKKINLLYFLIFLISGALVLNILGTLRAMDGDLTIDKITAAHEASLAQEKDKKFIFKSTEELSNVIRANNVLYDFTIENGTIFGVGYLDNLLGVVPGLRPIIIYPLLGVTELPNTNSAVIATKLLNSDHGMGTTCTADTFLNFGFWGTLIVFFIFGILMKKCDIALYYDKRFVLLLSFALCYLIYAIYLGRSSLFSPFNYSIYTWLFLRLNNIRSL